ncbi:MAG TPA: M56 family metallopeptidase [Gemmatimonadaceae bacterium]|jgi:beta-lactamase regulating signal transducer with metallopeptidase domain
MVVIGWMAYAALLTAMLAAGGVVAETIARLCGAPRRFVWVAVLALTIVAPLSLAFRPHLSAATAQASNVVSPLQSMAPARRASVSPSASHVSLLLPATLDALAADVATGRSTLQPDRIALAGWLLSSTALLALFFAALFRLRSLSRAWRESLVDGIPVVISPDVGPAVIGAFRPKIVLAAWTLTLDEAKRRLMLRHELEHIRARDPLLLRAATFALILAPWNAVLWFVVRRLRQTIEIDCDRRVLGAAALHDDVAREYGLLLLVVGARRASSLTLAAGFAADPPFLERRIKAMTTRRRRRPMLLSVGLASVSAVAMILASYAPLPASLRPVAQRPDRGLRSVAITASNASGSTSAAISGATVAGSQSGQVMSPSVDTLPPLTMIDTNPQAGHDESVVGRVLSMLAPPQARVTSRSATGRIVDSATSEPLANAYVSVIGIQALGEKNWTCSDANGEFQMRVPVGEAWISARMVDHSFHRVVLAPTDSVAIVRGTPFTSSPNMPSFGYQIAGIAVTPIRPQPPLIIVDGVLQPPTQQVDSFHLRLRTASGGVFERDWRRGDPAPKIVIDGREIPLGSSADYSNSNPCAK